MAAGTKNRTIEYSEVQEAFSTLTALQETMLRLWYGVGCRRQNEETVVRLTGSTPTIGIRLIWEARTHLEHKFPELYAKLEDRWEVR